ncbi:cathepsin C, putative [Cryptosporidium muris RN66]|uniref:Dipeptidyl peptidase 1 n=1 Tax=Cryptosporidium muris (strain RN66) TaxID=441375 RepID=B6AJW5_CRYMR|nr:cathepsin C, putative [Cryptosporidium muris RN66]EEA08506.1 cathepsin C, putative [Cryptosporidium muris RN66]|eukprot:XP_002142855.1 cathepsin C [Cryptosporidium muris RN66]
MKLLYLLLSSTICSFINVLADLPPNCLQGDVIGRWKVYSGIYKPCKEINQSYQDDFCGFPAPDRDNVHEFLTPDEYGNLFNEYFEVMEKFEVIFSANSTLEIVETTPDFVNISHRNKTPKKHTETVGDIGMWTMLLDQGFSFETKKRQYLGFFKYINEENNINSAFSYCHTTMLGWWDSSPNLNQKGETNRLLTIEERKVDYKPWILTKKDSLIQRGCWYGIRIIDGNGEITDRSTWTLKVPRWRISPLGLPPDHPVNAQNPSIAEYLKDLLSTYSNITDETNKLWDYSYELIIRGENIAETARARKIIKSSPYYLPQKKSYEKYSESIFNARNSSISNESFKINDGNNDSDDKVPIWLKIHHFDWSNPKHVYGRIGKLQSVVPHAKHQGYCGSCYAFTTATILTSRLWIKYSSNNDIFNKIHISPLQIIQCSVYNQGCDGGFITLSLKFAKDVGLRTEKCIHDYTKYIGVKQIFPTPGISPDDAELADDGHSFIQTKEYDSNLSGDFDHLNSDSIIYKDYIENEYYYSRHKPPKLSRKFNKYSRYQLNNQLYNTHSSKSNQVLKLSVAETMCWDLGGQLGYAMHNCKNLPPIKEDLPDSCNILIKVDEYSYINKVYGKTTPLDLMESIWNEGPVAISLEPTLEFSLYKSGIFKGFYEPIARKHPWADVTWYKVDHAMVLTGWGWEKVGNERIPYWIVQNSWGLKWGEEGYCRIIRGINELSIEQAGVRTSVSIFGIEGAQPYNMENLHDESVFDFIDKK